MERRQPLRRHFSATSPFPLEEDGRLQQTVTLNRSGCSLAEALQQLGDLVSVEMSAAPEIANTRLVLRIVERPAKEVMRQLALLLDCRWRRNGSVGAGRYEISPDLASKQKEQASRREALLRALAGLQEALRERLALAVRPVEALREELAGYDALLAHLERLPGEEREAAERSAAVRTLLERAALRGRLREMADPERRALIGVVSSLTAAQWDALVRGATLRWPIRRDLSDGTDTTGQVGVRLVLTPVAGRVQAALSVVATPVGAIGYDGETPPSRALMVTGYSPGVIEPDPADAASRVETGDPCLGKKRRLVRSRRVSGEDREATFSLGRLLTAIAESYGVDLIAAVDPEQRIEEPGPGEERSLREVLEQYLSPYADWRMDRGVLRVRGYGRQP